MYKMDFNSVQSRRAYFMRNVYKKSKALIEPYTTSFLLEDYELRFFQYIEKFTELGLNKSFKSESMFYKVALFLSNNHPKDTIININNFCLEYRIDKALFYKRLNHLVNNTSIKIFKIESPKTEGKFYFLEGLYLDKMLSTVVNNYFEKEFVEFLNKIKINIIWFKEN